MLYLAILKRFWWLIPVTVILVTAGTYRVQRDHARTQVATLNARITALEAQSAANVQKAIHDKETADAAYASSSKAAALLGASLADRVRNYQVRSCPVQAAAEPPGAVGSGPPAAEARPDVDAAIGAALSACARDADRLQNAHEWAETVARGQRPDARP